MDGRSIRTIRCIGRGEPGIGATLLNPPGKAPNRMGGAGADAPVDPCHLRTGKNPGIAGHSNKFYCNFSVLRDAAAERRNVRIDTRWATADVASIQRWAKELVAVQPDLILSHNTPTTAALLQQTRTIPIVFAVVSDPVGSGFVASFPRPGGNATGLTNIEPTMAGKWLELLREIAPRVNRAAILFNPATATYADHYLNAFKIAAASFGVEAVIASVRDRSELESVISAHAREPNAGLVVMSDAFTSAYGAEVTSLAARYRLPAIYPFRFFAELGGLMCYGNDLLDSFRRAADYADRILKGAKPSELPVRAPVKFELVINMKTAKTLGLDVPLHLQQRADEVIE